MNTTRVLTLVVLVLAVAAMGCFATARDRAQFEQVKALWASFPLYPGMREVHKTEISGFRKAFISKSFQCDASYAVVREFYVQHLTREGWTLVSERSLQYWGRDIGGKELLFAKLEYETTIEYAGERAGFGWDYGISIKPTPAKSPRQPLPF